MEFVTIKSSAEEKMKTAIVHLETEYAKLRTGKASPSMVEGLMVDYYGTPTPMSQVSNISILDTKTIQIQPWEKNLLIEIEKSIAKSDLGLRGINKGEVILIHVPALTEERRKEIVKLAKTEADNTKVGVRNARREANEKIKKLEKDGLSKDEAKSFEEDIQKLTDDFIAKIDKIFSSKETDLMKV